VQSYVYGTSDKGLSDLHAGELHTTLLRTAARQDAAVPSDHGMHTVVKCQDRCCVCALLALSPGNA